MSAKSICFFNHKGGVSKTTTTFNLGWVLAEKGFKVIVVDLDSQCNLTGLVLGYQAIDDDKMLSFYDNPENMTMKEIVNSLIEGENTESFLKSHHGELLRTINPNLTLLSGHLDVAELDSQISVSLKIAPGVPATRNIPGNLPKILKQIAERNKADYILYDLSPNVGGLNQVILMSSDYFIVPTSPDYFCLQAIGSLERNIKKWHDEIELFKTNNKFIKEDYPIRNKPLFLGAIHQRYRPRNEKPAKSFQNWINEIADSINGILVPSLKTIGCVTDIAKQEEVILGSERKPYELANVSDFNSLIAISQQLSKPIFALSDDDIKQYGKVFGHAEKTMQKSRNDFKEVFDSLGKDVIVLTS